MDALAEHPCGASDILKWQSDGGIIVVGLLCNGFWIRT